MRSSYLLKLAISQTNVPQQRFVQPLAQVIAQQHGVNPEHLKNRNMSEALAQLTNWAMGTGVDGATNAFARQHAITTQNDNALQILNSDAARGKGVRGSWDLFALQHKIVDPNVLKGQGENVLSDKKYQNYANPKNLGKGGRNGGQSLVR